MSTGILDILVIVAEPIAAMKGLVKALKTVLGLPKQADKTIQFIEKFITDLVDIEFGGPVPNNFRDFQAEAKITRSIVDLLEIETLSNGSFFLLKANYGFDLIVGPINIVTD